MPTLPEKQAGIGLVLLALVCACSPPRDQGLPIPLQLMNPAGGILYAFGTSLPVEDPSCDPTPLLGSDPGHMRRLIFDTGTPLSAFRVDQVQTSTFLRLGDGQLLIRRPDGNPAELLCDVPLLAVDRQADPWHLQWDQDSTDVQVVVGGDILSRYATSLSFSSPPDPFDPLCKTPPCLRLSGSSIADNCTLSTRGEAVFTTRPQGGGDISVEAGDTVFNYPATRMTLSACVEPLADPLPLPGMATPRYPCLQLDLLRNALGGPSSPLNPEINQVLTNQLFSGGQPATCPDPNQIRVSNQLEDLIDAVSMPVRDPHYEPSGTSMRLLYSTALPGLLLSRTAYQRLRGPGAAQTLFLSGQTVTIQFPGFPQDPMARRVQLGRPGPDASALSALALVNRERQLSPCGELARSRRQRYSFPDLIHYQQAACLQNLDRDASMRDRRCGYSGPSTELACDDHLSPVASVIELGGPLEALVVEDQSPLLQSANADLRNSTAAVDGIIGVSVLSLLQTEIDYPGNRLIAHCSCAQPPEKCRTYPRVTYNTADACANNGILCLPQKLPAACP